MLYGGRNPFLVQVSRLVLSNHPMEWKHKQGQPIRKAYKDLSLPHRYPRTFVSVFTGLALLVFFSRPLYDLFIYEPLPLPATAGKKNPAAKQYSISFD